MDPVATPTRAPSMMTSGEMEKRVTGRRRNERIRRSFRFCWRRMAIARPWNERGDKGGGGGRSQGAFDNEKLLTNPRLN